jgi:hypothetical protein
MSIFSRLRSRRSTDAPHSLIKTRPPADPKLEEVEQAAAADVAALEGEDHTYFDPDSPGHQGLPGR